jgi:signal transduction histidine kinase
MNRPIAWSYPWVYYLTVLLLFLAVVVRSLLIYAATPGLLKPILIVLAVWLVVFLGEPVLTRRWRAFFFVYLAVESTAIALLLLSPDSPDYFAILFALLSMRVMQRFEPRPGGLFIAAFTPLTAIPLIYSTGPLDAFAFTLLYIAADALFGYFSLAARRASQANERNQAMQAELQEANQRLLAYTDQVKQLARARERNRLARELHDSVTQTVFSMTLTAQSARLLLDRDPARVGAQLDHLNALAKSALSEMQTLISELRPENLVQAGLAATLRRHLTERAFPEGLTVSLEVEGDGEALSPKEEQALFRIAQEALNNVVKHAGASQACVHLHLSQPPWIEIADNGRGFAGDPRAEPGGVGLSSMRERAQEAGWELKILTAPGAGVRVRVEKRMSC